MERSTFGAVDLYRRPVTAVPTRTFVWLALILFVTLPARADTPVPPVLAQLHAFRGNISYVAWQDGSPASARVNGTLTITDRSWTLEERSPERDLRATANEALLGTRTQTLQVDDPLDSDALSNAWAVALGTIASHGLDFSEASNSWSAGSLRLFLDDTGAQLIGASERQSHDDVQFVFDDWVKAGPLFVPGHILRMRAGVPDAAFVVSNYRVVPTPPDGAERDASMAGDALRRAANPTLLLGWTTGALARGEMTGAIVAGILVLGVFVVAWSRRDALVMALCKRMARDTRGWRRAGVSLFVEPDGILTFDGMRYRVGPHFYGRAALVQCSVLFVRVTAPGTPRAIVLPRKFRPIDLGVLVSTKRANPRSAPTQ